MPAGVPARTKSAPQRESAFSSEGLLFRVPALLGEEIAVDILFNRAHFNPASSSHAREFRARFVFDRRIGLAKKAVPINRGRSIGEKTSQEFRIPRPGAHVRKTFRGRSAAFENPIHEVTFFAPDLNVKELVADPRAFRTRAPSRTHAFDDARRAHERVPHDFVRARIHPHVAGTRHRPIVGRPSVRVAGAFSRVLIHDAGARPDGPRDRPHARARARAPGGPTARPPHGSCRYGLLRSSRRLEVARSARELKAPPQILHYAASR